MIMTRHGSASLRKHESHTGNGELTNHNTQSGSKAGGSTLEADMAAAAREYDRLGVPRQSHDIDADLKRRARKLAVDGRVDHGTRWLIRDALEKRDPCLIQLVTRVEAGELD
jgi:hypothetical protein